MLDALAHAHGRGIVHRDVKPSNVLLAESDEIDVRLLDFGLAQMAEFDTLTAVGDVPGTLTYVSPERLDGQQATAAADIWAVGVMLWEALAGRHPFRSSNAAGTTRRIRAGAPPLESVRPDLPPALLERGRRGARIPIRTRARGRAARGRACGEQTAQAPAGAGPGRAHASRSSAPGELVVDRAHASACRPPSPPRSGPAGSPGRCRSTRPAGRSG